MPDPETIISALQQNEPLSINDIIEQTDYTSRENVKRDLRTLIGDGKISSTPGWEYKLATRLKNP